MRDNKLVDERIVDENMREMVACLAMAQTQFRTIFLASQPGGKLDRQWRKPLAVKCLAEALKMADELGIEYVGKENLKIDYSR